MLFLLAVAFLRRFCSQHFCGGYAANGGYTTFFKASYANPAQLPELGAERLAKGDHGDAMAKKTEELVQQGIAVEEMRLQRLRLQEEVDLLEKSQARHISGENARQLDAEAAPPCQVAAAKR